MKLSQLDWKAALKLLDEALDRAPAERQAWLATLPPQQAHLRGALSRLLDDRSAIESGSFLNALPLLPSAEPGQTAGQQVGPYQLLRPLGQGGMARVWLARRSDGAHQREVALKLPFISSHANISARVIGERFMRERQILSALTHPHIASVLDAGTHYEHGQAQPWLAIEYVEGLMITRWAEQQGLGMRDRLRLFLQVLQAVQHAHTQLVIHRDIKPSNVLVDKQGQVKLLDFGVAKLLGESGATQDSELTQVGGRALTPLYASPEQIGGLALSVPSDVYSLGVLLYELLTGQMPYVVKRDTAAALEQAILQADVLRPSAVVASAAAQRAMRGDIDTILYKAMHLLPGLRYTSAEAFSQDIQRHLSSQPILARPDTLPYRLHKLWGRQWLALSATGAVALALIGGTGVALWQAGQAREQAARAEAVKRYIVGIFELNRAGTPNTTKARQTTVQQLLAGAAAKLREQPDMPPLTRADLLAVLGEQAFGLNLSKEATALHTAQLAALAQAGVKDPLVLAQAQAALAASQAADGDYAAAQTTAEAALPALAALQTPPARDLRARLLLVSSEVQDSRAQWPSALSLARQALAALEPDQVQGTAYANALQKAGRALHRVGKLDEAIDHYRRALPRAQALGQWETVAKLGMDIANAKARQQDYAAAEAATLPALVQASALYEPTDRNLVWMRIELASYIAAQGRHEESQTTYDAALPALRRASEGSDKAYLATALYYTSWNLLALGRTAEAGQVVDEAVGIWQAGQSGQRLLHMGMLRQCDQRLQAGQWEAAQALAMTLSTSGDKRIEASAARRLLALALKTGRLDAAERALQNLKESSNESANEFDIFFADQHALAAELRLAQHRPAEAVATLAAARAAIERLPAERRSALVLARWADIEARARAEQDKRSAPGRVAARL